jgi:hypothetical protein
MSEGTVMTQAYQLPLNAFQLFGIRKAPRTLEAHLCLRLISFKYNINNVSRVRKEQYDICLFTAIGVAACGNSR